MTSPVLPAHPLDAAGTVKIMLSKAASDALAALGDYQLAVIAKPDATLPEEAQDRRILIVRPLTKELADQAYSVATGKARAVRIKSPTPLKL